MTLDIRTIRTEGLGDSTHLAVLDGTAIVVDPQRDFGRFLSELGGAEVRWVLETHLHNDYVSGGLALAGETGAELVMPAGAAPAFAHTPAFHGEVLGEGSLAIRPIHTPGHTPEHVSYLVLVEGRPEAVFSGGSLLVGTAGRSDLAGMDRFETLARLQHGSIHRLARLGDDVGLYPTHGAGSFCSASGAGAHTSTIGDEKRTNPLLATSSVEEFVEERRRELSPYPSYYRRMGPANLAGVGTRPDLEAPELTISQVRDMTGDAVVVDARPKEAFAAGHLPGSVAIELRDDFGVWAGWVLPDRPHIALVMGEGQDAGEAVVQLARVGLDEIAGVARLNASEDQSLHSYRIAGTGEFADAAGEGAQILDARAPDEWESGVIAGSVLAYAPDVAAETPGRLDPEQPVWVACETGYRANLAASHLAARGFEPVVLAGAGIPEVLAELSRRGHDELIENEPAA